MLEKVLLGSEKGEDLETMEDGAQKVLATRVQKLSEEMAAVEKSASDAAKKSEYGGMDVDALTDAVSIQRMAMQSALVGADPTSESQSNALREFLRLCLQLVCCTLTTPSPL